MPHDRGGHVVSREGAGAAAVRAIVAAVARPLGYPFMRGDWTQVLDGMI